jgi:hypothetical protein
MRVVGLLAACGAAALLSACGVGAPTYPNFGTASYRLEGLAAAGDGAPVRTVIYRDGPQMRVETVLPNRGEATIVFDNATNAAYVLDAVAAPSATATPPVTAPADASAPAPATGEASAAPAAGVAVRIDDAQAPAPLEMAWAALGADNAEHVGACEAGGEAGQEWRPRETASDAARAACITEDGIVLRITQNGAVLWEATAVQRGDQDPSLFGVPAGYELVDPQAVTEQVEENLGELGSVAGETPATEAQP